MIEIDDKIVSLDILRETFCCDLAKCKGICCVEGDSGAPLDIDEVDILEEEWENYAPYMTEEGRAAVEEQGFMVVDADGITFCAIERAYREGKCSFIKPISCHLYPIRVARFRNGSAGLNYHRWAVCGSARECGKRLGVPVYKGLKEPIIRAFGEDFYRQLELAEAMVKETK